jgi:hypothetical protein
MPGSIIVSYLFSTAVASFTIAMTATAFAINIIASAIISKAFGPQAPNYNDNQNNPNPGSRQQLPPAGDNKVPVVYGSAFVGGIITDLSITANNQRLFYVITLCEVTNTETGGTPDVISFGDIYWGGKKCVMSGASVTGLYDESTGATDTAVNGKLNIYTYRNGSNTPTNSALSAIQVMQTSGLTYTWDSNKLMSNCAFAIVDITYSSDASLTGLSQTKFQVINARKAPGNCFLDYLLSTRYGAALPATSIDTTSLTALDAYSNELINFAPYTGGNATQKRFQFDGTLDPQLTIMSNLQLMAASCDCLIKYNEITGKWGVIVQTPTYTVAMALNDSNIVSGMNISPMDLASSYNIIEAKYPDSSNRDSFNTVTLNLAVVAPQLLYTNEPVNKQSVSLPMVNNNVRAQLIANRLLESAREDLLVQFSINYAGLQLEAGDIVTVTNANYGWTNKLFRINRVTEMFGDDASITAQLQVNEYNPAVYDNQNITQFVPAPNTGIYYPSFFGTITTPTIQNVLPFATVPSFDLSVISSSTGITQYAEIWYSAYASPTETQRLFLTVTENLSGSAPYNPSEQMPIVTISTLPQGDWYFFVRMVNSLAKSNYSSATAVFQWRPRTFQYADRYLAITYADSANGATGFSTNPRNKSYYGLLNVPTANISSNYADYAWYQAPVNFSTANYLLFANRQSRRFSFSVGNAGFANLNGGFVPTETSVYDTSLWSGLPDGSNYIDLDGRSGQLVTIGTTTVSSADGLLSVNNSTSGTMVVSLQKFLNFGAGVYTKTASAASLTIDIYGRVVGFTQQDEFFFTETVYTATAAQTSFALTHIVGQVLVFRNGCLLSTSEYTETSTTVVVTTACSAGEIIVTLSMRVVAADAFYDQQYITVATVGINFVTYNDAPHSILAAGNILSFTNVGTPTQYTVSAVDTALKKITFTTNITAPAINSLIFRFRPTGSYQPYYRWEVDLAAVSSYQPYEFGITNGSEMLAVNGASINEIDYDLAANGTLTGFPGLLTGKLIVIQFANNNLGVPCSNFTNTVTYSTAAQTSYAFENNPESFELYANGVLFTKGAGKDFTATNANWLLSTAFNNNVTLINQQTFARIGAA